MARPADGRRTENSFTPPATSETSAASQCIRSGLEGISTPARCGRYDAAAVDDVEDGDGLARLALGVERIAAEIYEIERDAEDQQDRPRMARLGDVVEPIAEERLSRGALSIAGAEAGSESERAISSGISIEWVGKPNP